MSNGDDLTNNPQSPDSIYAAPASDTSVAPEGDLMAAYLGPKNANYYLDRFQQFEGGGGSASWNWPAFLVSSIWLLYRKMWLNALLYMFIFPIVLQLVSAAMVPALGPAAAGIFYLGGYLVIAFVLLPVFANRLYYQHAQGKIAKVVAANADEGQRALEAARRGGTSNIVVIILVILVPLSGILAAIAIPAYQDYTIRAQVSEGLSVAGVAQVAVSEGLVDSGELPTDNSTAGLDEPDVLGGMYTSSVEVIDGRIVVTYGNQAHSLIDGNRLELRPVVEDGQIRNWDCGSPDLQAKHLPAICR